MTELTTAERADLGHLRTVVLDLLDPDVTGRGPADDCRSCCRALDVLKRITTPPAQPKPRPDLGLRDDQ